MDILDTIVVRKREELAEQKAAFSLDLLRRLAEEETRPTISMRQSLLQSPSGIIAEFKRKSPSKGWINEGAKVEEVAPAYAESGAAALSILTDVDFFAGSLNFLKRARPLVNRPLLRKDFLLEPYHIYQARTIGADAVLLIAAALTKQSCRELAHLAHELSLEVLLEVHSESELDYLTEDVDMVGVNNRNLGTFHTDVANSFRIADQLPREMVWVSESGISQPDTIRRLRQTGYRGFLIGETFMKTQAPGQALQTFIHALEA